MKQFTMMLLLVVHLGRAIAFVISLAPWSRSFLGVSRGQPKVIKERDTALSKIRGIFVLVLCLSGLMPLSVLADNHWCDVLKEDIISLSEEQDVYLFDIYQVEAMEIRDVPGDTHDLYETAVYCEGIGAWSDSENTRIGMWWYSDPKDNWYIYYEPLSDSKNYTCEELASEVVTLWEEITAIYRTEKKESISFPDDQDNLYTTQLYCEGLAVFTDGEPTNIGIWNALDPNGQAVFNWRYTNEVGLQYTCNDLKLDIIDLSENLFAEGSSDQYFLGIYKAEQKDNINVPGDTYDLYTTKLYCEGIGESSVYGLNRIGMWSYIDPDGQSFILFDWLE